MTSHNSTKEKAAMFPERLYQLLEDAEEEGNDDVISWTPDGKGFRVHKRQRFENELMERYFSSAKFRTFQKSLSMWGFSTLSMSVSSPQRGISRNQFFVRGSPELMESMNRSKVAAKEKKKVPKRDDAKNSPRVATDPIRVVQDPPPSRAAPALNTFSIDSVLRAGINSRHANSLTAANDVLLRPQPVQSHQGGLGLNDETAAILAYLQRQQELVAPTVTYPATSNPTNQELLSILWAAGHRPQVTRPNESLERELLAGAILNLLR